MYDEWIREVKPASFSVFDQLDRTNNKVEDLNGGFYHHCRHANLGFWTLIGKYNFFDCLILLKFSGVPLRIIDTMIYYKKRNILIFQSH